MIEFEERAEGVLFAVFGGSHHWPKINKFENPKRWEINYRGDLATFDSDRLTRLVVAAHDKIIRASVAPSGPGMIKIVFHPRAGRSGRMFARHPTIGEVLAEGNETWRR